MLASELDRLAALERRHAKQSFETLRAALSAGERKAWKQFVEKYSRFVYTVALKLVSGHADAEELAASLYAATFDRLRSGDYRLLRGFRGQCRFTTYLYRVVQSERKEHFRRQRKDPIRSGESLDGRAEASGESPAPILRGSLLRQTVRESWNALSPQQQLLLQCRYGDGLRLREITALMTFRDTSAAARAIYSALARLKPIATLGVADDPERRLVEEELAHALRSGSDRESEVDHE